MSKDKKVVLFPGAAEKLMEKSMQAIEAENFKKALTYLEQLLAHSKPNFQINIGKIICLTQLGEQTDAILFCEEVMEDRTDEHFFDYLFYYVTLLFEANEYAKLVAYIDDIETSMDVSEENRAAYAEIYDMCIALNGRKAEELWKAFVDHLELKDYPKAWILFHDWATCHLLLPEDFTSLLDDDQVHPIIQTELLFYLKKHPSKKSITINKLNQTRTIEVSELSKVEDHPLYKEVIKKIEHLVHENPLQHEAMTYLLNNFIFVYYPLTFPEMDTDKIIAALYYIHDHELLYQTPEEEITNPYVLKILQAMNMYVAIVL